MTQTSATVSGHVSGRDVAVTVDIPAEPLTVWNALTRPVDLAAWLGRVVEGRPGPGHTFVIQHDSDLRSRHVVRRWELRSRLGFTWEVEGEERSSVCLDIEELDGVCRVSVLHEAVTDPVGYAATWHRHLEFLAAHLDGEGLAFGDFWQGHDDLRTQYTPAPR